MSQYGRHLRADWGRRNSSNGDVPLDVIPGINPGGGKRPSDIEKIFQDNQRTTNIRMQQEAVNSPADVQKRLEVLRKQQNRRSVLLLIQSRDARHWVPLPLTAAGPQRQPG